jgi:hypothetical protein
MGREFIESLVREIALLNMGVRARERTMKIDTRRLWIWGWLRFALGQAQMWLVVATLWALLAEGLAWITWTLLAAASAATAVSRLLYRGKSEPPLDTDRLTGRS